MKLAISVLTAALLLSIVANIYQFFDHAVSDAYRSEYSSALERDLKIFCNLSDFNLSAEEISEYFGVNNYSNELIGEKAGMYQFLINGGYFTLDSNEIPTELKHYYLGNLKIEDGRANCSIPGQLL